MIIQAYQEKACDDLAAIPVYIGYDRVVEEKAYLQELGGAPKEKERATEMIKSSKLLRRRYGRVYMNVGEPILLKSYLAAQEKPLEEMTVEERQSLYRRIGYTIVRAINKVSVVTPFALTAVGLLCYDRRGISLGELREVLELFYDYLAFRKVSFAMTFADREKAVAKPCTSSTSRGSSPAWGRKRGGRRGRGDRLFPRGRQADEPRVLQEQHPPLFPPGELRGDCRS